MFYRETKFYIPQQQDIYISKERGLEGALFQVWEVIDSSNVKGVLVGFDTKKLVLD